MFLLREDLVMKPCEKSYYGDGKFYFRKFYIGKSLQGSLSFNGVFLLDDGCNLWRMENFKFWILNRFLNFHTIA